MRAYILSGQVSRRARVGASTGARCFKGGAKRFILLFSFKRCLLCHKFRRDGRRRAARGMISRHNTSHLEYACAISYIAISLSKMRRQDGMRGASGADSSASLPFYRRRGFRPARCQAPSRCRAAIFAHIASRAHADQAIRRAQCRRSRSRRAAAVTPPSPASPAERHRAFTAPRGRQRRLVTAHGRRFGMSYQRQPAPRFSSHAHTVREAPDQFRHMLALGEVAQASTSRCVAPNEVAPATRRAASRPLMRRAQEVRHCFAAARAISAVPRTAAEYRRA